MKPVTLDFPHARLGRHRWLAGRQAGHRRRALMALLGLAIGVLALLLHELWTVQRDLTAARQALAASVAARDRPAGTRTLDKTDTRRLQQSARVTQQLNTPWPAMFNALERAAHPEVALVAIEPDVRKSSVRITSEARTLDALLAHARQVATASPFQQVVLIRHEVNEQDALRPVRLHLDAVLHTTAPSAEVPR